MSLAGKIAAITGGAMGIGRASALRLAEDGADIVIIDKAKVELDKTAEMIVAKGRRCVAIEADLLQDGAIEQAFAAARKSLGPIDILHNNVGQSAREMSKPFWEADPKVWDFILDLNLRTTMRSTRAVVDDMMKKKWGRVICTSSEANYTGQRGTSDYCSAKAGVGGFVRSLAVELAPFDITVNAVLPGVTRTKMMDLMPRELLDPVIESIPTKRLCEPEDIAHVVSFYASPLSHNITGTSLLVNGGRITV